MRRFAFFLGGLLMLPAFGEVAPVFYDEYDIEYMDADYAGDEEVASTEEDTIAQDKTPVKVIRKQNISRNNANRATATRATPSNASTGVSTRRATGNSARVVAARTGMVTPTRTTRTVSARGAETTTTRNTASRASTARAASGTVVVSTSTATDESTARAATNTANVRAKRVTTVGSEATDTLYNAFDSGSGVTTRVGVRSNASTSRSPVIRVASSSGVSSDTSVASTSAEMDELAELTDYCKAQYAACMDNYCNVLDENQGRCSCSANLKNYAKAEAALKQATSDLQDVAQKIQYIGLSSREIETLFSQTEAELTMQSKTDNSQIKTNLDKIKNMIIDVKSGNAVSSSTSALSFDMSGLLDFTIDSTGFDLSSLFGGVSSGTNSVNNQRGEELYKTATNRCKSSVLRACTANGVDASIITNAYDLEIDKECILYEKSLNDSNSQMVATVRNAQGVLQKARLMVAQAKNEYDMRGCINALDSCMQDEFVCGSDYENCLDPTGRYIVDGKIVVGSQPGQAVSTSSTVSAMDGNVCKVNLYRTWDFGSGTCGGDGTNAWGTGDKDTLADYINDTVTANAAKNPSTNMSEYLQNKIGYMDGDKSYGMCISVLNKCQDYTYTGTGSNVKYNPTNDVIKQYLARVLVQIKAKQDTVLADYAESCITDVSSCLVQNGYPSEEPSTWRSGTNENATTQANIAVNACRSQIVTCMSVNGSSLDTPTPAQINCWVMGLQFNTKTDNCGTNEERQ